MLARILIVAAVISGGQEARTPRARAAELFREAREAIPSIDAASSVASREYMQATAFAMLASAEAEAFPDAAADDAAQAFELARSLPGGGRDFEFTREGRADSMGRMAKTQIYPDAVRIVLKAGQFARARALAAAADIEHVDLYDPIVRAAPADQIVALALECRQGDGSFPYVALGDRVRGLPRDDATRRTALEYSYAILSDEATFKGRSIALTFVRRTYDLVDPAIVTLALERLAAQLIAHPARNATGIDRDLFGPELLEIMSRVNPSRAAALAAQQPEWDADRRIAGRTSFNPVRAPAKGTTVVPGTISRPKAAGSAAPIDPEQAANAARALAPAERAARLIQLGRALLDLPKR